MRRGLVIISGTQSMVQAFWFASRFPDCRLDAYISKSNLSPETIEQLLQQCSKCGCFEQVFVFDGFINKSITKKVVLFFQMLFYFLIGRRSELTKRIMNSDLDVTRYSVLIADSEYSVVGGAFIDHSDSEFDVYIMQEGFADIVQREKYPRLGVYEFACWLVAAMGYFNPAVHYQLKKTEYCIKITSMPSLLKEKSYRQILALDYGNLNPVFQDYATRAYGISIPSKLDADIIFMTSCFEIMGVEQRMTEKIRHWMYKTYKGKKIAIKKHPRDTYRYDWNEFEIEEIDSSIPAELLLPLFKNKTVVNANVSTALAELLNQKSIDNKVIYLKCFHDAYYNQSFKYISKELGIPDRMIVTIE